MKKPVVGVIGNSGVVNDRHNVQLVGQRNMRAVAEVAGALPLMFAGTPDITDIEALLGAVDGILLTGARANVHPTRFGIDPDPRHEPYDHDRDEMALSLIDTCVERGVPIFGICRGWRTAISIPIPRSCSPTGMRCGWCRRDISPSCSAANRSG